MNKAELVEAITDRLGDKRLAREAVEVVVDTITRVVATGEKVAISGFGVFEKLDRPARVARNPATGEQVHVDQKAVPKFRPASHFKAVVSGAVRLPMLAASTAVSAAGSARRGASSEAAPAEMPREGTSAQHGDDSTQGRPRRTATSPRSTAPTGADATSTAAKTRAPKASAARTTGAKTAGAETAGAETTGAKTGAKTAAARTTARGTEKTTTTRARKA